jgi:hypothetical protein
MARTGRAAQPGFAAVGPVTSGTPRVARHTTVWLPCDIIDHQVTPRRHLRTWVGHGGPADE